MAKSKKTSVSLDDIRADSRRKDVPNSGCEVWIYDDANRNALRKASGDDPGAGGMPPDFAAKTKKGLIVGYSMEGDGAVDPAVFIGKPFSKKELAPARWLEPQSAFLRLPSGALCIESNDVSRVGPEEAGEKGGARFDVPPGDYTLTLYRLDTEALDRESIAWDGPWEVLVLTPGGKVKDAADDLLPFEPRRDTSWIGKYSIAGKRAEALVWFDDYWDTFTLNLDSEAVKKLGLKPGSYFRASVPKAGMTLHAVYAASWEDGRRLPPPDGPDLDEFAYSAIVKMAEWNSEALFCRRDKTKAGIKDAHLKLWHPAVVEVLDTQPRPARGSGPQPANLSTKQYFDPGFLGMVLSELLPGVDDLDELPLPDALKRIDKALAKMGLAPLGDRDLQESQGARTFEICLRFYAGQPDAFAVVWAAEGLFMLFFLSELQDNTWILTGLADDLERFIKKQGPNGLYVQNPRVHFESCDESIAKIATAHKNHLRKAKPKPTPKTIAECEAAWERFSTAAFK